MGYYFWLAANFLLYVLSHRQDSTYHGLTPVVEHRMVREIAQWIHHEGSIQRVIAPRRYISLLCKLSENATWPNTTGVFCQGYPTSTRVQPQSMNQSRLGPAAETSTVIPFFFSLSLFLSFFLSLFVSSFFFLSLFVYFLFSFFLSFFLSLFLSFFLSFFIIFWRGVCRHVPCLTTIVDVFKLIPFTFSAAKIMTPPEFTRNYTGGSVVLSCEAVGFPTPHVAWIYTRADNQTYSMPGRCRREHCDNRNTRNRMRC